MDYGIFREFADSWGLLYLVIVWLGVLFSLFLPGAKKRAIDAAGIPLRDETLLDEDNKNE
ncbi:MAG TPA: cbb3-type cytochrome c oxidase subunit 3 [Devosia sp.]|nr:cbb3-type cytochrome c oxidase subunit 3 [Devosia sp.]